MSPVSLARLLLAYVVVLLFACVAVRSCVALPGGGAPAETVATVWSAGTAVERVVFPPGTDLSSPTGGDARIEQALAAHPGAVVVHEKVLGEAPILTRPELAFALSLVAGRDGVKATLDGKTAYVTPDELLAHQGYDRGINMEGVGLQIGADVPYILAMLADRLGTSVPALLDRASIHRLRTERFVPGQIPRRPMTAETMTAADVRAATIDAARFLALGVGADGTFRYMIDAPTNKTLGGYDWPRHAGATYFLAQAARLTGDPALKAACLRAADLLRTHALSACMMTRCIGTDDVVDIGSSALATIAFVEIVRAGFDPTYRSIIVDLAHFMRAQQRGDGEFMHQFDRVHSKAIDVQFLYFSGEATLALARAYRVTEDKADLEAAKRGLAHLVGPAWRFFGDRYYFGEEHWTCQAVDDLWDAAPDPEALDFCLRWHEYGRKMQYREGETPFDADGAYGVGPLVTPRLTPVGSRCEAGVATLAAARRAGIANEELAPLASQLRRSLALLLRHQLRPGATHLFADPGAVYGAMPGSQVDWQLRIDYVQHAGSAMIRWLEVEGGK